MVTKRKPPSGGLTTAQLKAHAAKRVGQPLKAAHKARISKGLMRSCAKKKGMTLSKYLKDKGRK